MFNLQLFQIYIDCQMSSQQDYISLTSTHHAHAALRAPLQGALSDQF